MRAQLDDLGIAYRFVDGVDGRREDLTRHRLYNAAKRRTAYRRDLTSGEIGCFLAHMRCYDLILKEGLARALILEDDIEVKADFPHVLDEILALDIGYDAIRFLGHPKTVARGLRPVFRLRGGYTLGRVRSTPGGGHAYLLSASGARKMLEVVNDTGIYLPIDILLGRQWETGIAGYAVLSDLVTSSEDQTISFIGAERFSNQRSEGAPRSLALNKAWFNIRTAAGKRWMYWAPYWRDRTLRARYSRDQGD